MVHTFSVLEGPSIYIQDLWRFGVIVELGYGVG